MITLTQKAPQVSAAELKQLRDHKAEIEAALAAVDSHFQNVKQLRAKQTQLRKKLPKLEHQAATFDVDAVSKLESTHRTLEMAESSIRKAEEISHHHLKRPLYLAIDKAQEFIGKLGQVAYNDLLDKVGALLEPAWLSFEDARWLARSAPAVNDFVRRILMHNVAEYEPVERLAQAAQEALQKISAFVDGGTLWEFARGGPNPPSAESQEAA